MTAGRGRVRAGWPAPIYISTRLRAGLVGGLAAALVLVCWRAPVAPAVLLLGLVLALLLSFPLRPLERVLPRGQAVAAVVGGAVLLVVLVAVGVVPRLLEELPGYVATLTEYQARLASAPPQAVGPLPPVVGLVVAGVLGALAAGARGEVRDLLGGAVDALSGVIGLLFYGFSLLMVTIYALADAPRFEAAYLRAVPRRRRRDARELWRALGDTLGRILGASILSNTVQGLMAFGFLTLIGVPYAVLLGAVMWVTAFIPYFGSWLGGIPAFLVALTVSPAAAALTAGAYLTINLTDGNVLTPRLQGGALRLHPLVVLLAVLAAGQLFGLLGVLLTLPLLAVLRVGGGFFAARLRTRPAPALELGAPLPPNGAPPLAAADGVGPGAPDAPADVAPGPTRTEDAPCGRRGAGGARRSRRRRPRPHPLRGCAPRTAVTPVPPAAQEGRDGRGHSPAQQPGGVARGVSQASPVPQPSPPGKRLPRDHVVGEALPGEGAC
jgi:predicted PurR-regulated permease PerM